MFFIKAEPFFASFRKSFSNYYVSLLLKIGIEQKLSLCNNDNHCMQIVLTIPCHMIGVSPAATSLVFRFEGIVFETSKCLHSVEMLD